MRRAKCIFAALFLLAAAFAQPAPPPVTISASVPTDLVRASSEILLEVTLTNVSDQAVGLGVGFGPPPWMMFGIDLRDSAGTQVAETEACRIAKQRMKPRGGPALQLQPGGIVQNEIILNRLFDLSRPGEYTVQVQRDDLTSHAVLSNRVTFHVPPSPSRPAPHPPFSITIISPSDSVQAGWLAPVEIAVKNLSTHPLRLADWQGVSARTNWSLEAQEFASGIDVRDAAGKTLSLTPRGRAFLSDGGWFRGGFRFISIPPGEVVRQTAAVGELSDITAPGTYTLRAVLADPESGLAVSSNSLPITVTGTLRETPPPFIITIRALDGPTVPLDVCMTNVSDHELQLDNSTTKNDFRVNDRDGNPVPLTNAGKDIRRMFNQGSSNTVSPVRPAESLCGTSTLATLFEMDKPGRYTVQVGRTDDSHPGQIQSNIATITLSR